MKTGNPMSLVRTHQGVLALLTVLVVVALAGQSQPSLLTTAITIGTFALIAVPLGFIYGQGGAISLAQATFAALGGYTSALLIVHTGWSPLATIVPAIVVPALVALVIARPILRLPELSLALATLAFGVVVEVAIQRGGDFTGGFDGLTGIPPIPFVDSRLKSFIFVWTAVALLVLLYSNFGRSSRGRALNAIRVDRIHAEAAGVPVANQLAGFFAVAAGAAGFAGWFYVHDVGFIAPESLNRHLSANLLFMVVIGGRKLALGPVVGVAIFVLARDALPGLESQGMFFGAVLIAVLVLLPDGLLSVSLGGLGRRATGLFRPSTKPAGSAEAGASHRSTDTSRAAVSEEGVDR